MQSANLHPFDLPIQRILVDFETRLPPWMKLVPPSQAHEATSAFARLTQEITAFADLVSPTTKEKKVREMIIGRLQNEVRKIWSHAKVIPIGSYAQGLYTSSSDMDLFVEVGHARQSLEQCLEVLYSHLEKRQISAPGTLTIVRTARVPIIKYIDSQGSGIQVDVSLNNISATSSTNFITHHLIHQPLLRPLTILLKQWLFQRQMNEVYSRGGLSSYALFLLVLTIIHQTPLMPTFPPEEYLGRWLWEFLSRWSEVEAFTEIVRPLKAGLQKDWRDLYTPYGLLMAGILDPVNEENCIGGQTFSIKEIQEEWRLSLTALKVAMQEYTLNINGGREKSLLASIIGLTTREYEARKQINTCQLPDETIPSSIPNSQTSFINSGAGGNRTSVTGPGTELKYPVQEFFPQPAKRIKFRNLLTKDGGLVADEEVEKMIARKGNRRDINLGELDLSIEKDRGGEMEDKRSDGFQTGGIGKMERKEEGEEGTVDLLGLRKGIEETIEIKSAVNEIAVVFELLDLGTNATMAQGVTADMVYPIDLGRPSPTLTPPSIATTSSAPSLQSLSTATSAASTSLSSTRNQLGLKEDRLLITPDSPPPSKLPVEPSLLLFENSTENIGGALDDLASLSPSFHSNAVNDLSGLIFTDLKNSKFPVDPVSDNILSPDIYSSIRDIFNIAENRNHFPNSTMRNNHRDLTLPTITNINSSSSEASIPGNQVKDVKGTEVTESVVFQGRGSRKSTPDIEKGKVSDAISAERAFKMFSVGIKKC